MNVNLHIERIVLQGNEFASVRSTDLNEALVGQINRQLMDQGMEFFDAYSERQSGSEFVHHQNMPTEQLASNLAISISSTLGQTQNR